MSKVKIFLQKGETLAEVESDLFKALNHHVSGNVHEEETFKDPAMQAVVHRMEASHIKIYDDMINEINCVLEEDYLK